MENDLENMCLKCKYAPMQKHKSSFPIIGWEDYPAHGSYAPGQHSITVTHIMRCPGCGYTEIYSQIGSNQ